MHTLTLEAVVGPNYLLHLPKEFPVGHRLRVTLEDLEAAPTSTVTAPQPSELGQKLQAIRARAIVNGLKLQSLESILAEVRADRIGAGDDQDLC